MGCVICGRGNCCKSFHSIEAQQEFDNIADNVVDSIKKIITDKVERLEGHYHGNNYYVRLDKVLDTIEEQYL